MAENANRNTLEQLKDKVHSGLDLVSDEELAMLFEEAEKVSQSDPTQVAKPDPSPAPVNVEPAPPAGEAPKGQASLLDKVPVKFKGEDEAATLDKVLKALQDTEVALTQSNQERSQLQGLVQELSRKPKEEYRAPVQLDPQKKVEETELDNLDDATFFDKASEIIQKVRKEAREIAKEESAKTVQHYDTFATRRDVLSKFKDTHSDFDNFRQEIVEVCKMHPEWDNDLNGLPKIYDAAKTLAIAKAKAINPASPQSNVNVEELTAKITAEVEAKAFDKAKQAIIEEVKKRKAAAGILSSRDASTSSSRVDDGKKTTPMTAEDKVLDDMMKSGPKSLGL